MSYCLCQSYWAYAQGSTTSPTLADSIRSELINQRIDTMSFNRLFLQIRKNRRALGAEYKPLLFDYITRAREEKYQLGEMKALDRLGLQERYDENYEVALEYQNQCLSLARELGDSLQQTYTLNNIGQVYRMQNVNTLAIKNFLSALAIQEAIGDHKGAYFTQNTLGATYLAMEEFDKALGYLYKSTHSARKYEDKKTLSFNYGCLGEVFLALNRPDSAMFYFKEGRKLKEQIGYSRGLPVSDHLIGQAYYALNSMSQAQERFEAALQGHGDKGNERYQSLCLAYLGKICFTQNEYSKAEHYLTRAKEVARRVNSLENLVIVEDALFDLYRKSGSVEKAYTALADKYAYRDTINRAKNERSIQALEVEYKTREKEQQIVLLSAESQVKSGRIRSGILIIILMSLIVVLLVFIFIGKQRNAKIIEVSLKHRLSQSQMNPHFVSNAMGSIQKFLYSNDAKSAASYLGKFSQLNRAVLEHSLVDSVALDEEINMLTSYLEFEQLRMNDAFEFSVDIDDEVDTEMIRIPPLFIQPFVENAVKHGVKDKSGDGLIRLRFTEMNKTIKVEIIDNGKGMVEGTQRDSGHQSRSMEITRKRLRLLKQKHKYLPNISIENSGIDIGNGVHVTIHLPLL